MQEGEKSLVFFYVFDFKQKGEFNNFCHQFVALMIKYSLNVGHMK